MRHPLVGAAVAFILAGLAAPPVWAQAPAPTVTITGLFDQLTALNRNLGDGNYGRSSDREWYARTRFRPDFTFQSGRTKAVMALEVDLCYGQSGPNDGGFPGNVTGAAGGVAGTGVHPGCNGGADINTDVGGIIEVKWLYTEFDLTGKDSLMPFLPVLTVARAGLQPFASLANYKALYATGDFAGLSMVTTFGPSVRTYLTVVNVEETTPGSNRSAAGATTAATILGTKGARADDWALILSAEWSGIKGLELKPMYSYFWAGGLTNAAARRGAISRQFGVIGAGGNNTINSAAALGQNGNPNGQANFDETRHTVGVDARWRTGSFTLEPSLLYQWGSYETVAGSTRGAFLRKVTGDAAAWLVDIAAGYALGPLLVEGRYIYSTGNSARDNLSQAKRYFEPLNTDTSYYAGWAQILAQTLDYISGGGINNAGMATNVGYDRYGRNQFGVRLTYSHTPSLALYTVVSPTWTAKPVDTDTGMVSVAPGIAAGTARTTVSDRSWVKGDSSYIGTEWDLGLTWRFAPNAVFDLVGGILFTGSALDTAELLNRVTETRPARDAYTLVARVRLTF